MVEEFLNRACDPNMKKAVNNTLTDPQLTHILKQGVSASGLFDPDEEDPTSSGVFNRQSFAETLGTLLYEGLPENSDPDTVAQRYHRAFDFFTKLQGHPVRIDPEPLAPGQTQGAITPDNLDALEADVAFLFSLTSALALKLLEEYSAALREN